MDPIDDVTNDGSDEVDILKTQQNFYESFKDVITDESTHGYCEVLNKDVLEDMIKSTMVLHTKLNDKELNSFSECLWEQRKLTGNEELKIAQIFVCCVHDANEKLTYPLKIKSKKFLIRPVYRIPKCYRKTQNHTNCCVIFVDEFGRVYQSWMDFLRKNKYGNCLIVAPKNGFYAVSANNQVQCDVTYQRDGVFKYVDYTSTAASLGSAGVILVGLIPAVTLAPAVIAGATAAGVTCAVYAAGRSIYQLFDRKKHDQSIGLGNRESRAAYFNITSGALCAGAAVGAKVAAQAALNRKAISDVAQKTIRYVGASSIGFQVIGCADDLCAIISDLRDKKPISSVYLAQFGAQIFLLGLSVKNFKLTQKLAEVSGQRNPKTIRKMLRQHNSDGSFKYLFSGADYIEKNIEGLTSPMMLRSIAVGCLNVVQTVKSECETTFQKRLNSIVDKLRDEKRIKSNEIVPLKKLLGFFLVRMHLKSLERLLEMSSKLAVSLASKLATHTELSFQFYLKTMFMSVIQNEQNLNINDFYISDSSFEIMVDQLKTGFKMVHLSVEFDNVYGEQLDDDLSLARKIHLIVEERCQIFIAEFIKLPVKKTLDRLADVTQYILKRLTIEAATFFFGMIKQILNECALKFLYNKGSPESYIKETFQMLLKKCNGNLKILETQLKKWVNVKDGSYDRIKKESIDHYFTSKSRLVGKFCGKCGGETFR